MSNKISRKKKFGAALLPLVLAAGAWVAVAATQDPDGSQPVTTSREFVHTDTATWTYTIPAPVTVTSPPVTVTTTQTVTVTNPGTTTEPPPDPQCSDGDDNDGDTFVDFPADPGCTSAADDSEAPNPPPPPTLPIRPAPNQVINRVADWNCNSELNWPIRVNTNIPNNAGGNVNGDVQLDAGCTAIAHGGNDGTCDLYLNINGNGGNLGSATDGMVLRGAHDIDVCGVTGETDLECGAGQSHKDGVQENSGFRIGFWEFQSGNWQNKTTTCHGAGGMFYVSALNNNNGSLIDVVCHYCVMVGGLPGQPGGKGLTLGASIDSGGDNGCWMGRVGNRGGGVEEEGVGIRHINVNNVSADVDAPGASPPCPALSRL